MLGRACQRTQNCVAERLWPTSEDFHYSCDISPGLVTFHHHSRAGTVGHGVRQLLGFLDQVVKCN